MDGWSRLKTWPQCMRENSYIPLEKNNSETISPLLHMLYEHVSSRWVAPLTPKPNRGTPTPTLRQVYVCVCIGVFFACVCAVCPHAGPITPPFGETVTWQLKRIWKHVGVNILSAVLRRPKCTEIILRHAITTFLSILTSVIRNSRPETNLCLHSC